MTTARPSFLSGHTAGRAFAYVLQGLGPKGSSSHASVGRNANDEIELMEARDVDEAFEYCTSRRYASAVVWTSWETCVEKVRAYNIHVLQRQDGELQSAGCIECLARLESGLAAKLTDIDVRDEHLGEFLDGFAEGSAADEDGPAIAGAPLVLTPREDTRRLGLAVGEALAGELVRILDGEPAPRNAVGVFIPPGMDAATIVRSDDESARDRDRYGTRQGATIERGAGGILVITLPKHWGSSVLLLLALEVSIKRGQLQTSTVASAVSESSGEHPDHAPFVAALHQGVARHPRAAELLGGIGALGEFRRPDDLWNEPSGGRLSGAVRRAWRAVSSLPPFQRRGGARPEKVMKLGIQRDPAKVYRLFGGDVCAMPRVGSDAVLVISPDRADYELVRATGITPEAGYVYFLDQDGDLSRTPQ